MVATLSSLAPAKLNSTVIPVKSVGLSPGIISAAIKMAFPDQKP